MSRKSESELALEAMKRAAETARLRAARFHSRLVAWGDGRVVFVDPDETIADGAVPHPIPSRVRESDD